MIAAVAELVSDNLVVESAIVSVSEMVMVRSAEAAETKFARA